MANKQLDAITRVVHPEAAELVLRSAMDFATSLILQAKVLAHARRDNVVLTRHVEDARYVLSSQEEQRSWSRQVLILIGSAVFGASFSAFVREVLASQPNMPWIVVFVAAGFVGMLLVSWRLRR